MAHHYQETDVSCGVAALQMALEDAGYEAPVAHQLAEALGTDLKGTRPWAFEAYLRAHRVSHITWHGDVTLGDLRELLAQHAVMVCYQSKELRVGHFAIVTDLDDGSIELDDPWFGPGKRLALREFEGIWESRPDGARPLPRWVLGIARRD